jgi:hypothetical protein
MLFSGGKPRGECPGGDIKWLNTRVMILGNNSGLLSFACCLKAGKRIKITFSGFFIVFLVDLLLRPFKVVTVEALYVLLLLAVTGERNLD